jgi:hypothetical protein
MLFVSRHYLIIAIKCVASLMEHLSKVSPKQYKFGYLFQNFYSSFTALELSFYKFRSTLPHLSSN